MITKVMTSRVNVQNISSFKGYRSPKADLDESCSNKTTFATSEYAKAQKAYFSGKSPVSGIQNLQKNMEIEQTAAQLFSDALDLRLEAQEKIKAVKEIYQKCKNNEVDESIACLTNGDSESSEIMEEYDYPSYRTSRKSIFKNGELKGIIEYHPDDTTTTLTVLSDKRHMHYKTPQKSVYASIDGPIFAERKIGYKVYGKDSEQEIIYVHKNPIYGEVNYSIYDKTTHIREQGHLEKGRAVSSVKSMKKEDGAEERIDSYYNTSKK